MANKNTFWISDADKEWVNDCFSWLIRVYGYPDRTYKTILFTKEFFPLTFSNQQIDTGSLIADLGNLLDIPGNKFTYELVEDVRDTQGVPYEIYGVPFECEMEITEKADDNYYHLSLAKTLIKHPGRLLLNLIIETVKAKQLENRISFENVEEIDLLMFHVAIYFGYGVLLYENLVEQGKSSDGLFWESKWNFISSMPIPVMAYALALYYDLKEENDPVWRNDLKPDLKIEFESATDYIQRSGNPLFNKQELIIRDLMREADTYYLQNDFHSALSTYQKILFLEPKDYLKADLYVNIGYNYLRLGEYEKSIPHFQKALEINPGDGYANDNIGFAFIMSGDLESGRFYLNAAMQTDSNDAAYSYRNFALYHLKRKEYEIAEQNFQKAFDSIQIPVDLLEYFYAQFLFETEQNEKGMEFLAKAVEKGEPEAIELMKKM